MKQLLFLLLFPCLALAQYQGNGNQKITLGEQTTADGLVWRGRTSDTSNLMTNKLDTSAYLVLDTITEAIWLYRASTTPKWNRVVDSLNNLQGQLSLTTKVTGVLPVANGGTGITTMPAGYILHGDGTSVDTAIGLFWDRSNFELGIGTNVPEAQLHVFDITKDATILISGLSAFDQNFHFFNSAYGITKAKSATQLDLKSQDRFTFKTGTAGSQVERIRITPTGMAINLATVTPTAYLTLGAGTSTVAPIRFTTSGATLLSSVQAGAVEFNGTNLLFTPSTTRHTVNHGLTGSATLNFPSTTTLLSADLTIAVTGAADGDVVSLGVPNAAVNANTCYTAWVSAANTVTVRFNNYSSGTVDPASGTFKVFVTK